MRYSATIAVELGVLEGQESQLPSVVSIAFPV